MKMRLDAVVITLTALFLYALTLAGKGSIDLGPFPQMIIIVLYFTLLSYYYQFRRAHLDRNYILLVGLAGIYAGAAIGYLVSGDWEGTIKGGGLGLLITLAIVIPMRKRFYAWIDRILGEKPET